MLAKGRRRRILLWTGSIFGGLVLLIVALPLWFPWVGRAISARFGVRYAAYHRAGYGQFVLQEVTFTNAAVRFQAQKVESVIPTAWLWRRWRGQDSATFLRVENWKLNVVEHKNPAARTPASVYAIVKQVELVLMELRSWVPKALLTNGVFEITTDPEINKPALQLRIPAASWVRGAFAAKVDVAKFKQSGTLAAKLEALPYEIDLDSGSLHLRSAFRISQTSGGLTVTATNSWWSNRVEASAVFGRQGLIPEQARLGAESLRLPAEMLGLKHFEDVNGSLAFQWQQKEFALDVRASARPDAPTNVAPVDVQIHSTGSTESAFVELARISTPWLQAELTPGTEIKFASPFLNQEAVLKTAVNLDKQAWFAAAGKLQGEVKLRPAREKFPATSFNFSGAGIALSNVQTKTLALNGELVWPWLDVSRLAIGFVDGSIASLAGRLQLEERIVRDGHLTCDGAFGRQFLPAANSFERAGLDVTFHGGFETFAHGWKDSRAGGSAKTTNEETLTHSGKLIVQNFTNSHLQTLQLSAKWEGEGLNLGRVDLAANGRKSSLNIHGAIAITNMGANLLLNNFSIQHNNENILRLENPCQISLGWGASQTNRSAPTWRLNLTPFHCVGAQREVNLQGEVDWPRRGKIVGAMRGMDSSLLADFLKVHGSTVQIRQLNVSGDWNEGPANLLLQCSAGMTRDGIPFTGEFDVKVDGKGVTLERMAVSGETQPVFSAQGFLPLTVTPGETKQWMRFLPDQPLHLQAMTQTNSLFWSAVADLTGVVLAEPRLNADVAGTWAKLRGELEMRAKQVKLREHGQTTVAALTVQNVDLLVELDQEMARIKNFSLLLENQPVTVSGEMPLGRAFWAGLQERQTKIDWQKASARLKMENAQVGAFAGLLPNVLSREGKVSADLALLPGLKLTGELRLSGASTRPMGSFGVIRDIDAELKFAERVLDLKGITASVGGAPVSVSGRVDLTGNEWLKGTPPPFQIKVWGLNMPLAREPDLIVRADLDVKISEPQGGPAVVTGEANLRDSFFLRDLHDLLPGGVASPSQWPPYFSIEAKPWADWRLDLRLKGERFLKVNSPLFRGVVSSDLKLTGTLQNPLALGSVKIDSGVVQFPFANLDVTQGFVTLTSDNPYRPDLLVTATVRNAGYDVRMEVNGPADQPVVQFSSTPPLSSEQIVLMLTAGVIPRSDYSLSTQQRAGRVALFLGKNLLSQAGFGQQSERLTIRTGENISETGRSTYHAEYKLSQRWYLVGEYDQFNAFNAGLRWRIYSK